MFGFYFFSSLVSQSLTRAKMLFLCGDATCVGNTCQCPGSCPPGQVQLGNCTCALTCGSGSDCPGFPNDATCHAVRDRGGFVFVCVDFTNGPTCSNSGDCPVGQACINASPTGICRCGAFGRRL